MGSTSLASSGDPAAHPRRFNDKDEDQVTGLSYYGYRYYDSVSLGWTQSDPMYRFVPDASGAKPRQANLYVFSLDNPVRYRDSDGRQSRVWMEENKLHREQTGNKLPGPCNSSETACQRLNSLGTAIGVSLGVLVAAPVVVYGGETLATVGHGVRSGAGFVGESLAEGAGLTAAGGAAVLGARATCSAPKDTAQARANIDAWFVPPDISVDSHGHLTNGEYKVNEKDMAPHTSGSTKDGKSQFLSFVDADKAVLDAAAYADEYGLWNNEGKAKVPTETYIGVLASLDFGGRKAAQA